MPIRRFIVCLSVFNLLACAIANAQNSPDPYVRRQIAAVKTSTPPSIDGDLSDPAWKDAAKATVFVDRQSGSVVRDLTTAWLAYDEKHIYIAFSCKESQPEKIVARETLRDSKYAPRDGDPNNEDNVEVLFDPFRAHREEDMTRFSVNAIGTRSAKLGGGRGSKVEWQGDWDGAAKRLPDGWTVEMRIPWAMLNYPNSRQPITMGVNFTRFQEHTRIESIWSNVGKQNFLELEGLWTGVQVPANAFRRTLSLLPYLLPSSSGSQHDTRLGLDARYTLTPELTAVATANPDFATVEGAVESIGFSRSERFIPEKRPFFLEGQDYLQAGAFYMLGPYFYTQRIESFDVGTKLYGKISPRDTLGMLHTLRFGHRSDLVAQYRHDFSPTMQAGLFLTQKTATDDNNTLGVATQNARWGKFGIASDWAFSAGTDAGGGAQSINLTYQDKLNFSSLVVQGASPHFRAADGLIFFTDQRGFSPYHSWGADWRKGFWRKFNLEAWTPFNWHYDGRPYQRGGNVSLWMETRSDWGFGLEMNYFKFDNDTDATVGLRVRSGVSNRFRMWGLKLTVGQQASRPSFSIEPEFSFRLFKKLDIAYNALLLNMDGRHRQHILTLNYELTPTRSFGGRVVRENGVTNWYLFFRNAGLRGMETYLMFGDPNAQRFASRLALKFVYPL